VKPKRPDVPLDGRAIDALYGLEPVIELQPSEQREALQFTSVQCPYCGERFDVQIDLTAAPSSYIEDCQICCRPIEISVRADSTTPTVSAGRLD